MVSPSNTSPGLTRGPPLAEARGEPDIYYPTGTRNYARTVPREDVQGVAHAMLAKQLGLRSVYTLFSDEAWRTVHTGPFASVARDLGIEIAGERNFTPESNNAADVAGDVARSGADGVLMAGPAEESGAMLKAVRARVDDDVEILMTDSAAPIPFLLEVAGPAARGVYMSFSDAPPAAGGLTAAGRRFAREFGFLETPSPYAVPAAQAAEVVLDAIARSDGTRGSVLSELQETEVEGGILGSFRFDENGDIVPARIPIMRITGKSSPSQTGLFPLMEGSVVDRVLTVPERLSD